MPRRTTAVLWIPAVLGALLACAALVVTAQAARFAGRVAEEARALFAVPGGPRAAPIDLAALPPPVRRYAEVSGALGQRSASSTGSAAPGQLSASSSKAAAPGQSSASSSKAAAPGQSSASSSEAAAPGLGASSPSPPAERGERPGEGGRAPPRTARLRHGGSFLVGRIWRPIRGVQYLAADPPGFVWWGRIRLAPGVWVDGRDRSVAGEGNMRIVAASTWTLADVRGPELDQGALVRLLGELAWLPGALLDPRYVTWTPVDERSARARLAVGGRAVEATFHFGPDGLPERFEAERQREVDGRGVLTPFVGHLADFGEVGGLRVPFRLEAAWILDGREQPYARWEVERIELDRPEPYP